MARKSRRGDRHHIEEDQNHYWMSFSDLMSALLLMFALFLMVTMLNNQASMEEKDKMIEEAIGVKTKIIEELRQAFSDSDLQMEVDPQTGAIRFSDGVFFATNSSRISAEGRKQLETFIPRYIGILLSEPFRDEIAQIIVEGHTDQTGSYIYNLDLSQQRSASVVKEIISDGFPDFYYKDEMRPLITSNGRSFSEPVYYDGEINYDKSRRVEFKFRLKDDELIKEIQKLVSHSDE